MQDNKNVTLIVGLSNKPDRYAYRAAKMLKAYGHQVEAFGLKPETVLDIHVKTVWNEIHPGPDTVTLYVNPARQAEMIPHIIQLKPRRIIFNPGTENDAFESLAQKAGIQTEIACTLVLLATGTY